MQLLEPSCCALRFSSTVHADVGPQGTFVRPFHCMQPGVGFYISGNSCKWKHAVATTRWTPCYPHTLSAAVVLQDRLVLTRDLTVCSTAGLDVQTKSSQ